MAVLDGIRIVEIAGIGPGPFCGMLLADMGAEVNLVERANAKGADPVDLGKNAIINRGKRSVALDLKDPRAIDSVQALEPQFNALLFSKLGLGDDTDFKHAYDPKHYSRLRERLTLLFASQPRQHWVSLLEGSDACFAPVLTPAEAMTHPHMAARGVYTKRDGVLQAAPAPRFSAAPAGAVGMVPRRGEHGAEILGAAGLSEADIAQLLSGG